MNNYGKIKRFRDVVKYIDKKRIHMRDSVDFFETLKDSSLPKYQRMLFTPYMLFFSLGSPDLKTLMMRYEKPHEELTIVEKKFNKFISEDNYHYNFYLNDLEKLGYLLGKFGTTSAVVRHVFAEEGIPVRRLVYVMSSYIRPARDPLIAMAIPEIIEAGLFELFSTVYQHIVNLEDGGEAFQRLEYFGETHVKLEQNHTVTSWFAPGHPEDEDIADCVVPSKTYDEIKKMVDDLIGRFAEMYEAFDNIVKRNQEIQPEKFDIQGFPPIDKITWSG